jgi:hypothetical protein
MMGLASWYCSDLTLAVSGQAVWGKAACECLPLCGLGCCQQGCGAAAVLPVQASSVDLGLHVREMRRNAAFDRWSLRQTASGVCLVLSAASCST